MLSPSFQVVLGGPDTVNCVKTFTSWLLFLVLTPSILLHPRKSQAIVVRHWSNKVNVGVYIISKLSSLFIDNVENFI